MDERSYLVVGETNLDFEQVWHNEFVGVDGIKVMFLLSFSLGSWDLCLRLLLFRWRLLEFFFWFLDLLLFDYFR